VNLAKHYLVSSVDTMKRTIVLGASPNPDRYSHKAVIALDEKNHEVFPIGIREGKIKDIDIITDLPKIAYVHTITIYLKAMNQKDYYEYIINTKPKRIIFNPGAENLELSQLALSKGIKVEDACTLVMLKLSTF